MGAVTKTTVEEEKKRKFCPSSSPFFFFYYVSHLALERKKGGKSNLDVGGGDEDKQGRSWRWGKKKGKKGREETRRVEKTSGPAGPEVGVEQREGSALRANDLFLALHSKSFPLPPFFRWCV